ncbi:MAG: DUF6527 family protein [Burkholderiaceae bacterium]
MSVKLSAKLSELSARGTKAGQILLHYCPGCKFRHAIHVEHANASGARWSWDGNTEQPTFAPSVKITTMAGVCHYFIRSGRIEFCRDSTHALAGYTLDLPDLPW